MGVQNSKILAGANGSKQYVEELFLLLDGMSAFYMQVSSMNKLTFTVKTYILKTGL